MHGVVAPDPGGPEALQLVDLPTPQPGPGEVLVDVVATAVNRADLLQRRGLYRPPAGATPVLGLECSGRVAALGPGVTGWAVGDEVCALLTGGGYAEQVVVPAGQLMPVPAGVPLVHAAALPEVACTVWSNVVTLARLQPGETLLVHGGTSGIGTHAIQVGALLGARVVVTVGSAAKAQRARELGAARAVEYRDEDFVEVLRAFGGADVVLDNMGASYLARNVSVLRPDGRLVVIGLQGGVTGELPLGELLARRGTVHATALRARPAEQKAAIVADVVRDLWPAVAAGQVRPVVDRVLPLAEVGEAHRVLEASEHVGKVLLQVR